MDVLQVNSVFGAGSAAGRIVENIHQELVTHGHRSRVGYGRRHHPDPQGIRIGTDLDLALHGVKTRLLDRHGLASTKATREFCELIQKDPPELVHLHGIHGYYLNYEVLFDFLARIQRPIVWTLHDCWQFTGHCGYFTYAACSKWQTTCGSCPELREYPTSWFVDSSERNFQRKRQAFLRGLKITMVSPSQWLADLVPHSMFGDIPVEIIPNDVDHTLFRPYPSDWRTKNDLVGATIILAVSSRWERRKGLDFVQDLASQLRPQEKLVVVGRLPARRSLPASILHVPFTDSVTELASIYSSADVFINPTLEDNYPTTNLEALACGTPIVTFDTGGCAEAVARSVGPSAVIGDKTVSGLRHAIDKVLSESPEGPHKVSLIEPPPVKMAGRYVELYGRILEAS